MFVFSYSYQIYFDQLLCSQEISVTESNGQNSVLNLLNMIIDNLFLGNGIILALHIIQNRKLHKASFQMTYNVAVCTVDTLNL